MNRIDDEVVLLWVAREAGVLDALLSSAETPTEVAEEAGVTGRAARILTRALADRGFFERVDGTYEPTNRALGFLTRRDLRSVGSLPHRADLLARYRELSGGVEAADVSGSRAEDGDQAADGDSTAEGGSTADGDPPTREPEHWTVHRLGRVVATEEATRRALVTAAVRERPGAERVLDVGGAPGVFAREFATRGFETTLVARPDAAGPSRPYLATSPVDVVAADYASEDAVLPRADLAFVPGVTHRLGPGDNRRLLSNLADALAPGGTVVLTDHVRGDPDAAAVAVEALATTAAGDTYPADRYRGWLDGAGFVDPSVRAVPGTDRSAVVGVLPE